MNQCKKWTLTPALTRRWLCICVVFCIVFGAITACFCDTKTTTTTDESVISETTLTEQPTVEPTESNANMPVEAIVLKMAEDMDLSWTLVFEIPYGPLPEQLGVTCGGDDGEGAIWGPEYGIQLPDTTWWMLDAGKSRLAHYDDSGAYLGDLLVPPPYLGSSQFFWLQRPAALADNTFVASNDLAGEGGLFKMASDGDLSQILVSEFVRSSITDGTYLYGFKHDGTMIRIDPATGSIVAVDAFVGQTGDSFSISLEGGRIQIVRPDVDIDLPIIAEPDPEAQVHVWISAAMGSDGRLWILMGGFVEEPIGEAYYDVAGLFYVERDGTVSSTEGLRTLWSEADGGAGPRLSLRFGDDRPCMMFIDNDAVRVYRKAT